MRRLSLLFALTLIPSGMILHEWLQTHLGADFSRGHTLALSGFLALLAWAFVELRLRKLTRELTQLHRQNNLLNKTFQHMPDHLAVIDRDYRVQACNWQGIFSHVAKEKRLNCALCYETFYPGQNTLCETCHVRDVFANGQPTNRIKHTQEHGYLEIRSFPLFNNEGLIDAVVEQASNVTQRIETERALRESERKLQAILHSINDPIRVVDKDLNIIWANEAAYKIFGEVLLSKKCCALYELDMTGFKHSSCPTKAALTDGNPHQHILTVSSVKGDVHTFKTSSNVIEWDQQQHPTAVLEVFWDITEIKQAESALRRSETLFRTVVESSKDAMVAIDKNGHITLFNPGAERIFGHSKKEILNLPVERLMPDDYHLAHSQNIRSFFAGSKPPMAMGKTLEFQGLRKNSETFPAELSLSEGRVGGERFVLAVIRDITERKLIEQQLIHQANYDSLTGLPNRTLILDRLKQAIVFEQRHGQHLVVILLDLDNFKSVNDTLGHDGGNLLLKEVACRLSATMRNTDTVGRLYGDEFIMVLRDVNSTEGVMRRVRKLVQSFEQPFSIAGNELLTSVSVGIAMFPKDGSCGDELLKKADTAMYESKKKGKNCFSFFAPSMEESILQRMKQEKLLQQAVINRSFHLHYQPRIETASGRIIGLEALLRWTPEGADPIPPDQFVPILEETGWIKEVGEWILETVCRTARAWQEMGLPTIRVWVNISGKQFLEKDLFEKTERILDNTGLAPYYLGLELTESVLMQDVEVHIAKLEQLKKLGLLISLDDFGTGYSSLSYLKRFPIDEIKIDRSFVDGLLVDENDTAIVHTILAMAKSLGLRVVAEGVETPCQRDFLTDHLCDEMQGYLFSKPVPPESIAALLASGNGYLLPCSLALQKDSTTLMSL